MNAIETEDLRRVFGARVAVEGLSLSVPKGRAFAFLGPNGAGKTTTVRMLSALIAPSGGKAKIAGYWLHEEPEEVRRRVGLLTEAPGLYDQLTARQNLRFFASLYGLSGAKIEAQMERYLRALDLWGRHDEIVGGFSKGMRQKLAIVRALMHEPEVVFFDEPTSGLDPEATRTVRDFVKSLKAEGRTIFLTTHNLPEADELCEVIGVFRQKLLRVGTPHELRASLFAEGVMVRVQGGAAPWQEVARSVPGVSSVVAEQNTLQIALASPEENTPRLVRALCEAGADLLAVQPTQRSLEEVYLALLSQAAPAAHTPGMT
jgi:ABC-2 type transport system ATP-binding protein